jgi:dipeptidyl aminopeptidase/acylaminoacyl peptidase
MSNRVDVANLRSLKKLSSYSPVALSPDGALVAYGIRAAHREIPETASGMLAMGASTGVFGIELWMADLTDGTARALTSGWGSSWGPRWSPDGQWLAFYSDRNGIAQVWLWNRGTGEVRVACEDAVCISLEFEQLHWLPDSTHLVAKLRAPNWNPPQEREAEALEGGRDVWESPPPRVEQRSTTEEGWRWFDGSRGDIGLINIRTGAARRLGTELFPQGFVPSPDGRFIAATSIVEMSYFDLHLFAVDGSSREVLARKLPSLWGTFSWSPTSDAIAFTTYREDGPGQLMLVSLDGEQRVLHDGEMVDFASEEPYPPPLWSPDGETVYCGNFRDIYAVTLSTCVMENITQDLERHSVWGFISTLGSNTVNDGGCPGTVLVLTQDRQTKRQGIHRVGNGQPEVVLPEQQRHLINLMLYGDSNSVHIVGPIESAAHPADIFRIAVATGEENRVTRLNPELEGVSWGEARLLDHAGVDGEALQGAVLLPAGYQPGVRYPTIVSAGLGTGGSGFVNDFEWDSLGFIELHALTTRGYVVIVPSNPRRTPDVADEVTAQVVNALDASVAAGYSDPERAGVMGHSRGGYSACSVITRTDRFRAAVAGAPITNFVSFGLDVSGNEMSNWEMATGYVFHLGNTLWEAREQWLENSPALYCDSVTTPLLLTCGTADENCMAQAEEMYGGLRQLGKRATLVRYHGEGHVVGNWSTENAQDCWDRIIGWFDRYVKGDMS